MPDLLDQADTFLSSAPAAPPETGSLAGGLTKAAGADGGLLGRVDDWLSSRPVREAELAPIREQADQWAGQKLSNATVGLNPFGENGWRVNLGKEIGSETLGGVGISVKDVLRKAVPFSELQGVVDEKRYGEAKKAYEDYVGGKSNTRPTDAQVGQIAEYELDQQREAARSQRSKIAAAGLGVPKILGEFAAAGPVVGAPARLLGAGAGTAARLGATAAGTVLATPLMPEFYLEESQRRANKNGGNWYDSQNVAAPLAKAAVTNVVLGQIAKLAGGAATRTTSTAFGNLGVRAAVGAAAMPLESSAAEALTGAVQDALDEAGFGKYLDPKEERYRTFRDMAAGKWGDVGTKLATDALIGSGFAAFHGREAKPVEALQKAVDALADAGAPKEQIPAVIEQVRGATKTSEKPTPVQEYVDALKESRPDPLAGLPEQDAKDLAKSLGLSVKALRERAGEPGISSLINAAKGQEAIKSSQTAPEEPTAQTPAGPEIAPQQTHQEAPGAETGPAGAQARSGAPEQVAEPDIRALFPEAFGERRVASGISPTGTERRAGLTLGQGTALTKDNARVGPEEFNNVGRLNDFQRIEIRGPGGKRIGELSAGMDPERPGVLEIPVGGKDNLKFGGGAGKPPFGLGEIRNIARQLAERFPEAHTARWKVAPPAEGERQDSPRARKAGNFITIPLRLEKARAEAVGELGSVREKQAAEAAETPGRDDAGRAAEVADGAGKEGVAASPADRADRRGAGEGTVRERIDAGYDRLTDVEKHILTERQVWGRDLRDVAADPELGGVTHETVRTGRKESLQTALKKLGISPEEFEAQIEADRADRGELLAARSVGVRKADLTGDPKVAGRAAKRGLDAEEKIQARLEKIGERYAKKEITLEEADRLVAEVTGSRDEGKPPEHRGLAGLSPPAGKAGPALGTRAPAARPAGLGKRNTGQAEVKAEPPAPPAVEPSHAGLPAPPPDETTFRGGYPGSLGQQGRPAQEFALAREKVTEERTARGDVPVLDAARRSNEKAWGEAMATMARDPEAGAKLVDRLEADPHLHADADVPLLLLRRVALSNAHDSATREYLKFNGMYLAGKKQFSDVELEPYRRAMEDALIARNRLDDVTAKVGTQLGRGLQFYRQLVKEDYSLSRMLAGAESAKKAPLTDEERKEITTLHDRIKELEDQLAKIQGGEKPPKDKDEKDIQIDINKEKGKYREKIDEFDRSHWSRGKKVWETTKDILGLYRSFKTAYDLSSVLRQGGILTGSMVTRRPVQVGKNLYGMIRDMMSVRHYDRAQLDLTTRPNAKLYKEAGLYLADLPDLGGKKEEAFEGKFRGLRGRLGLAASERAYSGYLNRLRADVFDYLTANPARGRVPTLDEAKALANFVNVATGRGRLPGSLEKASDTASLVLFAPRHMASRFQLLLGQPFYKGTAHTRLLIAKEFARSLATLGAFYGLVKAADQDADITFDPRSSDFGKIRFGNFRLDPLAGLSQTAVFLNRMLTGEMKSTTTGKVHDLRGPGHRQFESGTLDVASQFARNKLAPAPALAADLVIGKSGGFEKTPTPGGLGRLIRGQGKPGDREAAVKEAKEIATPISVSDVTDALKDQGVPRGAALALAAILGMGTQLYVGKQPRPAGK